MRLNRKTSILTAGILLVAIAVALPLIQFGPPGIKVGDDRLLASLSLSNGEALYLVTHRTPSWIDTYEVSLYRVDSRQNVFVNFLGDEQGYWWRSSLKFNPRGDVEIVAKMCRVGVYSVSGGSVSIIGGKPSYVPGYKVDGDTIQCQIPEFVRPKASKTKPNTETPTNAVAVP